MGCSYDVELGGVLRLKCGSPTHSDTPTRIPPKADFDIFRYSQGREGKGSSNAI